MADANTTTRHPTSPTLAVLIFPPWVHFLVGIIMLGAWIIGNIMQIQTTQAWILQSNLSTKPDFTIFGQFAQFFSGAMDPRHVVAFVSAWGAQIILLCCKIGLSVSRLIW